MMLPPPQLQHSPTTFLLLLLTTTTLTTTYAFFQPPPAVRPPSSSFLLLRSPSTPPPPLLPLHHKPALPVRPLAASPRDTQNRQQQNAEQQQQQQQQQKNVLDDLERQLKGGEDQGDHPFAYITQTPQGKQRIPLPPGPNQLLITFSIVMGLALGALGVFVGNFVDVPPLASVSLQPGGVAMGVLLALPLFGVDTLLQGVQEDTASEVYSLSIFGTKTPLPLVLALATAVTIATGFGEEVLFRGLIQQGLADVVGAWPSLVLASAIFGLAHKLGPSDLAFITMSGAYMGLSFQLTGDLTVPIALHAFYDFAILMGAYFRAQKRIAGP